MTFSGTVLRPGEKLRVVALENQWVAREGMIADFERGGIDARLTGIESEFLALVEAHKPHVAVIDLRMNESARESRGLNCLREIKAKWPLVRCVVYTSFRDLADFRNAVASSVDSYVVKDAKMSTAEMVKRVADGGNYMDPILMKGAVGVNGGDDSDRPLTARQLEIVRVLAQSPGATNADIGKALDLSPETVKTHMSAILERLGVHNREDVAFAAQMRGLR